MNNIDLRQAIINRVQGMSNAELTDVIEGSIGHDERALPGLGVLFEMIWQKCSDSDQSHLVQLLHDRLQNGSTPSPAQ